MRGPGYVFHDQVARAHRDVKKLLLPSFFVDKLDKLVDHRLILVNYVCDYVNPER